MRVEGVSEMGTDHARMTGEPDPAVLRLRFQHKIEVELMARLFNTAVKNWDMYRGEMWGKALVDVDDFGRKHSIELTFKAED